MRIALASPPFPNSINDALYWVDKLVKEAKEKNAEIYLFSGILYSGLPGTNVQGRRTFSCKIAVSIK